MKSQLATWALVVALTSLGIVAAAAATVAAQQPQPASDKLSAVDTNANPRLQPGDWRQWGGTSYRNNVPVGKNIPLEWNVGGLDRKTGKWDRGNAVNIRWIAALGSNSYGNPVVASGKVFVGTNNGAGYLKRYPNLVDLGCLLCFDEKTGKFLWQHSSEKLSTGRVHDWPLQGICCAPLVEGDRLWFVTSRGEVRCLDVEGYHDGEDDGPVKGEWARLFNIRRSEDAAQDPFGAAVASLNKGQLNDDVSAAFARAGVKLSADPTILTVEDGKQWTIAARVGRLLRQFKARVEGPLLSVFKLVTPADKDEADVIWDYDMMSELGVSQRYMCSCSVTVLDDILFVNTSHGHSSRDKVSSPLAPSFIAMDKNTGKVFWTDRSTGVNILHGQWSSPAAATLGRVPQVIFGGGDGWVYSFRADKGKDGRPELLWKFDANPKTSRYILGARGTRNNIIATPVIYDGLVYVATGQDPQHGEGEGHLWCIDPTRRGDVSAQLAVLKRGNTPIDHRRLQAVIEKLGEAAIDNPNSAAVWHYDKFDSNGDKQFDFEERMHRSCGTVAIKNDLLYIADFSGLFHCLDAKTGRSHWTYDMLAAAWGSPLIVNGHVYIGDEDGDVSVFKLSSESHDPVAEINMGSAVYSTPIVANDVLFISNRTHLFAIQKGAVAAGE